MYIYFALFGFIFSGCVQNDIAYIRQIENELHFLIGLVQEGSLQDSKLMNQFPKMRYSR